MLQSGLPFNVGYRDAGADRDVGPNRPDQIGDAQIGSGDGITSPYFNNAPIGAPGSAFGRPARGTFGNLQRSAFRVPSFWNVDGKNPSLQVPGCLKAAADWLYRNGDLNEPWVFLIGGDGKIVARFDNVSTRAELEPILRQLPVIGPP